MGDIWIQHFEKHLDLAVQECYFEDCGSGENLLGLMTKRLDRQIVTRLSGSTKSFAEQKKKLEEKCRNISNKLGVDFCLRNARYNFFQFENYNTVGAA